MKGDNYRKKRMKIETSLKWSTWTDNDIGDEGARFLSEVLKTNSSLTGLDLYSDEIDEVIKNERTMNMNSEWYWRWRGENDKWRTEK